MDPERKVLLAIDVGERTLAMAQRVVHHVAHVLAPDGVPPLSDGWVSGVSDGLADALWPLGAPTPDARAPGLLPSPGGCHDRRSCRHRSSRPCGDGV